MKVLLLTPISPIVSSDIYHQITEMYAKTNVGVLCFPFFAELRVQLHGSEYVPAFFAMLQASLEPEMHKKLYDKQNMLVIGNTYKEEKFDMIIAYQKDFDEDIFDTYVEVINHSEELSELKRKAYTDQLYTLDDAEIKLPSMDHVKLFLEGVFK